MTECLWDEKFIEQLMEEVRKENIMKSQMEIFDIQKGTYTESTSSKFSWKARGYDEEPLVEIIKGPIAKEIEEKDEVKRGAPCFFDPSELDLDVKR